ncbi:hypothetical protein CSQ89_06365 [Chitinimonas sp. BJB300]|nr:hypothetical protein CSQ89_06365 [Chitinimonas sp. BJB300]
MKTSKPQHSGSAFTSNLSNFLGRNGKTEASKTASTDNFLNLSQSDNAVRSSAPLAEVFQRYADHKAERLASDISKSPVIAKYLVIDGKNVAFHQPALNKAEFTELVDALKQNGHHRDLFSKDKDSLLDQLKAAWKQSAPLAQVEGYTPPSTPDVSRTTTPTTANPFGDENSNQPELNSPLQANRGYPTALDPFADDEQIPASSAKVRQSLAIQSKETESSQDTENAGAPKKSKAASVLSAIKGTLPSPHNKHEQIATADRHTGAGVANIDTATPETPLEHGIDDVLIGLLNKYINEKDGHVDKLRRDIRESATIRQYVELSPEGAAKWRSVPKTNGELQRLFDEFKTQHKGNGSLYTTMSNFSFSNLDIKLITPEALEKIIHDASKPALHRPGKADDVAMKTLSMKSVITHFSSPSRHEVQMKDFGAVESVIAHYGRVEKDQDNAREAVEQLEQDHAVSLNDRSLTHFFQRIAHRVKTSDRVEKFGKDVAEASAEFHQEMEHDLEQVGQRHHPDDVATRTKDKISIALNKAHKAYAAKTPGTNIFPERLENESAVAKQVDGTARKNYLGALQNITDTYERGFVQTLSRAVESFSFEKFFRGKSAENIPGNVGKIHESLIKLYDTAEQQHQANLEVVLKQNLLEEEKTALTARLDEQFGKLKDTLATQIREKFVDNYQTMLNAHAKPIDKVSPVIAGDTSQTLKTTEKLAGISRQLVADVTAINRQQRPEWLGLHGSDLGRIIKSAATPQFKEIEKQLPETTGVGKTILSGLERAFFKLTPTRIATSLGIGLAIGGSITAVAAVGVPVGLIVSGIVTGGVFPAIIGGLAVAGLVWWVAKNINICFKERAQVVMLKNQIKENQQTIEAEYQQ